MRIFHDQDVGQARPSRRASSPRIPIVVVRFQGPQANGMPELHSLTPTLSVLQDRGLKVALVTDGRMSGASGKVPAAIHVSPEAAMGGPLARLRDGDMVRLDAVAGTLTVLAAGFRDARAGGGRPLRQRVRHRARVVRGLPPARRACHGWRGAGCVAQRFSGLRRGYFNQDETHAGQLGLRYRRGRR